MVERNHNKNHAVAEYISELTAELAKLASSGRYTALAYALEIARLEAEQICGHCLGKVPEPPHSNIVYLEARK
jgi:hypothetical protein